tara:strand:+ start:582 stop:974 length:393 start_codon:yes stop_codon:yes gene_type:complete
VQQKEGGTPKRALAYNSQRTPGAVRGEPRANTKVVAPSPRMSQAIVPSPRLSQMLSSGSGTGTEEETDFSQLAPQIMVIALRPFNHADKKCLKFEQGDLFEYIKAVDDKWAVGKLDGVTGVFPRSYVEQL